MRATIYCGDALTSLKRLRARTVQCCVTSPPYWGLRDYGVNGQLGLEKTPEEYTARLVEIFREVRRVLKDDGTLWLNLGDSYAGGGPHHGQKSLGKSGSNRGTHTAAYHAPSTGLKPKDLVGIPWRVAFALQTDGWYLRSDIIWHKPNPMPESVTDRPTKAHEYLFLLTKSERYFYNAAAVVEPAIDSEYRERGKVRPCADRLLLLKTICGAYRSGLHKQIGGRTTRNRRSVWTIATRPFKGAHFATFPPKLIEPCILAGSKRGSRVLDPFAGAGTTGLVANQHGRRFVGIELNPDYIMMAERRLAEVQPKARAA